MRAHNECDGSTAMGAGDVGEVTHLHVGWAQNNINKNERRRPGGRTDCADVPHIMQKSPGSGTERCSTMTPSHEMFSYQDDLENLRRAEAARAVSGMYPQACRGTPSEHGRPRSEQQTQQTSQSSCRSIRRQQCYVTVTDRRSGRPDPARLPSGTKKQ